GAIQALSMKHGKFLLCLALWAILGGCRAATPVVVKVGLIAPFEGADRDTGYSALAGVRLALQEQNERAGSFRVELVALDDHHDRTGQLAAQRAAELVADPAVVAVIGGFGDASALGAAPVLTTAGVPFIVAAASDDTLAGAGIWRLPAGNEAIARQTLEWTRPWPVRRWSVAGQGALAEAMRAALADAGLVPVARADEADALFYAGDDPEEAVALLRNLRSEKRGVKFVGGPALDTPRFAQLGGDDAIGAYYVSLTGPADEDFVAAYRKENGAVPFAPASLAYRAATVLLALGKGSPPKPTRASLGRALRELRAGSPVVWERSAPALTLYQLNTTGYPGVVVAVEGKKDIEQTR
ncbi:MAG: ABC transporter substrate-binding protein, partial [Chloroflexi bacterium]|nr:ABC transporter substrate-binding protein [Chloroflexota bacterium]